MLLFNLLYLLNLGNSQFLVAQHTSVPNSHKAEQQSEKIGSPLQNLCVRVFAMCACVFV
jgi:hypothetical protein